MLWLPSEPHTSFIDIMMEGSGMQGHLEVYGRFQLESASEPFRVFGAVRPNRRPHPPPFPKSTGIRYLHRHGLKLVLCSGHFRNHILALVMWR